MSQAYADDDTQGYPQSKVAFKKLIAGFASAGDGGQGQSLRVGEKINVSSIIEI